jgi:hypothetical protein
MQNIVLLTLAAVAVLMFKHAVADFYLQTAYQYLNKGKYGHPGGFIHAGIQTALRPLVYLVMMPGSFLIAGAIALGEFLPHRLGEGADHPSQRLDTAGPRLLVCARHRPAHPRPDLSRNCRGSGYGRGLTVLRHARA